MKAICYKNTITTLPNWEPLHDSQKLGFAYETDSHFVHFYGKNHGIYVISSGLTVIEEKQGALIDWVSRVFGATDIEYLVNEVGHTTEGVWRPALYFQDDTYNGLKVNKHEQRSCEQALRILVEKLDDILLYIEPDGSGLNAYGHKTRELLILACTEVENQWKALIKKSSLTSPSNGRMYTTQDYVKLCGKAYLNEYQVKLRNYNSVLPIIPFGSWSVANPTQSLDWYDAYNKTKHDRDVSFNTATLNKVISAVAANFIMYCVRFSPVNILHDTKVLSSIVNHTFEIELINSDIKSFYVPELSLPINTRKDICVYDSRRAGHYKPWVVDSFIL